MVHVIIFTTSCGNDPVAEALSPKKTTQIPVFPLSKELLNKELN